VKPNGSLRGALDTTFCDKVCQWLATGQWFSLGTPASSNNKTDSRYNWNIVESGIKLHKPEQLKVMIHSINSYEQRNYKYCMLNIKFKKKAKKKAKILNPTFLMSFLKVFILSSISPLIFFFSSSVFLDSFILDTILFNNCSRNCCCHLQLFNKNPLIIRNKSAHDLLNSIFLCSFGTFEYWVVWVKGTGNLYSKLRELYSKLSENLTQNQMRIWTRGTVLVN